VLRFGHAAGIPSKIVPGSETFRLPSGSIPDTAVASLTQTPGLEAGPGIDLGLCKSPILVEGIGRGSRVRDLNRALVQEKGSRG
jgi:hypothetical protein